VSADGAPAFVIDWPVEFAFYVNKSGWRSKRDVTIYWEGTPTGFGECGAVRCCGLALMSCSASLSVRHGV
jgi:hypothetical protein